MPNMDYPEHCVQCDTNELYTISPQTHNAMQNYCTSLAADLIKWKMQLGEVLSEDVASSNTADQLNLIKSVMKELEGIVSRYETECPPEVPATEVSPGMLGG